MMLEENRTLRTQLHKVVSALSDIVNDPGYLLMENGETGEPCELMAQGRQVLKEVYGGNSSKCIVHGCSNYAHEGAFVGDMCSPCYRAITTGNIGPTDSFLKNYETLYRFAKFVARDYVELSHDKTRMQRDDYIHRARKIINDLG